MIRLDRSASTVLVVCQDCDWRALATTDLAAWDAGRVHERQVHPGHDHAEAAYLATRRRHSVRRL